MSDFKIVCIRKKSNTWSPAFGKKGFGKEKAG
jgi:hypothetical protein